MLGFIGGGNMSTAIAQGIVKTGTHPAALIWVSGPHLETLEKWRLFGANITTENGEVIHKCDIVFLGVKPGMLRTAVSDCLKTLPIDSECAHANVLFVSMLAGITLHELNEVLSSITENPKIIRIMPNTPVTVGAGACIYSPGPGVSEAQCKLLEKLMNSCGICEKTPESLMDSMGSLVGCGPAYMYLVIEALADGAVKQGVPRKLAQRFAAQVVIGSGEMVLKSGKHPGLLKDEVCSPGGSTIYGVLELENGKIRSTFMKALEASTLRSKELGNK